MQFLVRLQEVAAIDMEDDAAVGQGGEIVEVMIPIALAVKQGLMAVFPELLDAGFEGGPVMGFELGRRDKRHAATMHPNPNRHLF